MRALSHEASELVNLGREAFRPTDADRARVLAAVLGAAPLVGGAAVVAASKVTWTGLTELFRGSRAAQLLAVAMPAAAAGGLVWYAAVRNPTEPSTASMPAAPRGATLSSPAVLAPPRAEPTPALPEEPERTTPEPASEHAASPRPAPSTTDSSNGAGQIGEEVALLTRAQAELSRGRAQPALEALREHAQRFPRGALSNERIATRARALCALGRTQEADAELDRVERLNPGSPYWARAREACRGK
jgi:hypothetical protein